MRKLRHVQGGALVYPKRSGKAVPIQGLQNAPHHASTLSLHTTGNDLYIDSNKRSPYHFTLTMLSFPGEVFHSS
jgi:hypothetical protein